MDSKAKERGEYKNIELELLNNRLGLFHWALPFYIMAFILLALTWLGPGTKVSRVPDLWSHWDDGFCDDSADSRNLLS